MIPACLHLMNGFRIEDRESPFIRSNALNFPAVILHVSHNVNRIVNIVATFC